MIAIDSQNTHHHWADYTSVASDYKIYLNYAQWLIKALGEIVPHSSRKLVADIGAGTGKLTDMLGELGASGFAIEPNDAMRVEGEALTSQKGYNFAWLKGTAEDTGLDSAVVDWVCMGSSLHWTDTSQALTEARRILKPGGSLSILWDLRDNDRDPTLRAIEAVIQEIKPNIRRAPTIVRTLMQNLDDVLKHHGFVDCIRLEAAHCHDYTPTDYVRAWRMVRDLAAQTTSKEYETIMGRISTLVAGNANIPMYMRTYCFTSRLAP